MKEKYEGNVLEVVECIKDDLINELYMIKLNDTNFECDDVEKIQFTMNTYLDIINGIYQDIITEYIDYNSIICVFKSNFSGEVGYSKIGDE